MSAVRHPDRQTAWVIVLLAHVVAGAAPSPEVMRERLTTASSGFPLIASRLHGKWWIRSRAPEIAVAAPGSSPLDIAPIGPFDLQNESPVRVVVAAEGEWLLLCAHHFAIDGLGMVSLMNSILTGARGSAPDYTVSNAPRRLPTDALRRLATPADPIAPSAAPPPAETFVSAQVQLTGRNVTARLGRACAEAAWEHNRAQGRPLRRFGLSVAVGGAHGEGATYRRIDFAPGQDVETAVSRALADPSVPADLTSLPPGAHLLRPLLKRFSDTMLVSNLGRLEVPASGVEFYPVARGRSAVAVGAAGLAGRPTTVTLRARDLDASDATALLNRIVIHLERTR